MNKIDLSIIIPAYNEENSIKTSLTNLINVLEDSNILFELIIVNDGSSDNTSNLINDFKKDYEKNNILIIENKNNIGKSASLHKGIGIVKGRFTTIHDADLEYNPLDLVKMYNLIYNDKNLDSVYGSRYLDKKRKNKQKKIYYLANLLNLFLFNLLFNSNLTDLHSCYKIFKTNILQSFNLKEKKFGFELEVTTLVIKNKLKFFEIPIFYSARSKNLGKKISFFDEINFLISIFKFRFLL